MVEEKTMFHIHQILERNEIRKGEVNSEFQWLDLDPLKTTFHRIVKNMHRMHTESSLTKRSLPRHEHVSYPPKAHKHHKILDLSQAMKAFDALQLKAAKEKSSRKIIQLPTRNKVEAWTEKRIEPKLKKTYRPALHKVIPSHRQISPKFDKSLFDSESSVLQKLTYSQDILQQYPLLAPSPEALYNDHVLILEPQHDLKYELMKKENVNLHERLSQLEEKLKIMQHSKAPDEGNMEQVLEMVEASLVGFSSILDTWDLATKRSKSSRLRKKKIATIFN